MGTYYSLPDENSGPLDVENRDYITEAVSGETYAEDKYEYAECALDILINPFDLHGALYSWPEEVYDEGEIGPHWYNWITDEYVDGHFFGDADLQWEFDFNPEFDLDLDLSDVEWEWSPTAQIVLWLIDGGIEAITWFYDSAMPRINLVPEGEDTVEVPPLW